MNQERLPTTTVNKRSQMDVLFGKSRSNCTSNALVSNEWFEIHILSSYKAIDWTTRDRHTIFGTCHVDIRTCRGS